MGKKDCQFPQAHGAVVKNCHAVVINRCTVYHHIKYKTKARNTHISETETKDVIKNMESTCYTIVEIVADCPSINNNNL